MFKLKKGDIIKWDFGNAWCYDIITKVSKKYEGYYAKLLETSENSGFDKKDFTNFKDMERFYNDGTIKIAVDYMKAKEFNKDLKDLIEE